MATHRECKLSAALTDMAMAAILVAAGAGGTAALAQTSTLQPPLANQRVAPPSGLSAGSAPVSALHTPGRSSALPSSNGTSGGLTTGPSTLTAPLTTLRQPGKSDMPPPNAPGVPGSAPAGTPGTVVVTLPTFTMTGMGYTASQTSGTGASPSPNPITAQTVTLPAFTMTGMGYTAVQGGPPANSFTPRSVTLPAFTMTGVGH